MPNFMRRCQLSLVLIGVAIGTRETRELVKKRLIKNALRTSKVGLVMDAIERRDTKMVTAFFEQLGVQASEGRLVEAIVDSLNEDYENSLMRDTLRLILAGEPKDLDGAEDKLQAALDLIKHAKAGLIKTGHITNRKDENG